MSQKGKKYPPVALNRGEVSTLVRTIQGGREPAATRNAALVVLLFRSGLRLFEALALKPADVDLEDLALTVWHGKEDKYRRVGFDKLAREYLERWLAIRQGSRGEPLFNTSHGTAMSRRYVAAMLTRAGEQADIGKRIHAHGLRHAFASDLAREGVPIAYIQRLLGHASAGTTELYLQGLTNEEAVNAVRNREGSL